MSGNCSIIYYYAFPVKRYQFEVEQADKGSTAAKNKSFVYKKALNGMADLPELLHTCKDAKAIKGIGDKIIQRLQKRLDTHLARNPGINFPEDQSIPVNKHVITSLGSQGCSSQQSQHSNTQGSGHASSSQSNSQRESAANSPAKAKYVPAFRSGGYAILLTLLNETDASGYMTRSDIIKKAQILCDASFDIPTANYYTAWNAMKLLLEKGLVIKHGHPPRFCLTDEGTELAKSLDAASSATTITSSTAPNLSSSFPSVPHNLPPPIGVSRKNTTSLERTASDILFDDISISQPSKSQSTSQDTGGDKMFYFVYVADDGSKTTSKNLALVDIGDNGLIFKIEYFTAQETHPLAPKIIKKETVFKNPKNKRGFISDTVATDLSPSLIVEFENFGNKLKCPLLSSSAASDLKNSSKKGGVPSANKYNWMADSDDEPSSIIEYKTTEQRRQAILANRGFLPSHLKVNSISSVVSTAPPPIVKSSISATTVPSASSSSRPNVSKYPRPISIIQPAIQPTKMTSNIPATKLEGGTFEIILVLDSREIRGKTDRTFFRDLLIKHGIQTVTCALQLGDMTWIARPKLEHMKLSNFRDDTINDTDFMLDYIVERKTSSDLVQSIKDGRFEEQKFRLNNSDIRHVIYLVEQVNMSDAVDSIGKTALQTAMSTTQIGNDFFLKRTAGPEDSVKYLALVTAWLKKKFLDEDMFALPVSLFSDGAIDKLKVSSAIAGYQKKYYPTSGIPLTNVRKTIYMPYRLYKAVNEKTRNFTRKDIFIRQLLTVRGMSAEKVKKVTDTYPTVMSLMKGYEKCSSVQEKEKMLFNLGNTGRNSIGPALSKKVCIVFFANEYPEEPKKIPVDDD